VNINISLPIRSVATAVAKPFVVAAKFIGRGVNNLFQFAARGLAAASRIVSKTPITIKTGASVSAHWIATTASTAVVAIKTGVAAVGASLSAVAAATWGYVQFGSAVLFSAIGNVVNATVTPAIVWALGSKATAFSIAVGSTLQWIAAIALPVAIIGGIMATIHNVVESRRRAQVVAQTVVTETGIAHEVVSADGPDPMGVRVAPESNGPWDTLADEDEAAEKISFQSTVALMLGMLDVDAILAGAEQTGVDFFAALPQGDKDDYTFARTELKRWVTANAALAHKASQIMNGFDKGRRMRTQERKLTVV